MLAWLWRFFARGQDQQGPLAASPSADDLRREPENVPASEDRASAPNWRIFNSGSSSLRAEDGTLHSWEYHFATRLDGDWLEVGELVDANKFLPFLDGTEVPGASDPNRGLALRRGLYLRVTTGPHSATLIDLLSRHSRIFQMRAQDAIADDKWRWIVASPARQIGEDGNEAAGYLLVAMRKIGAACEFRLGWTEGLRIGVGADDPFDDRNPSLFGADRLVLEQRGLATNLHWPWSLAKNLRSEFGAVEADIGYHDHAELELPFEPPAEGIWKVIWSETYEHEPRMGLLEEWHDELAVRQTGKVLEFSFAGIRTDGDGGQEVPVVHRAQVYIGIAADVQQLVAALSSISDEWFYHTNFAPPGPWVIVPSASHNEDIQHARLLLRSDGVQNEFALCADWASQVPAPQSGDARVWMRCNHLYARRTWEQIASYLARNNFSESGTAPRRA